MLSIICSLGSDQTWRLKPMFRRSSRVSPRAFSKAYIIRTSYTKNLICTMKCRKQALTNSTTTDSLGWVNEMIHYVNAWACAISCPLCKLYPPSKRPTQPHPKTKLVSKLSYRENEEKFNEYSSEWKDTSHQSTWKKKNHHYQ